MPVGTKLAVPGSVHLAILQSSDKPGLVAPENMSPGKALGEHLLVQ